MSTRRPATTTLTTSPSLNSGVNSSASSGRRPTRGDWAGWWEPSPTASGSLAAHFEGMGLPEVAQAAGASIVPYYAFEFLAGGSGGSVKISCASAALGLRERVHPLDVLLTETSRDGSALRMTLRAPTPGRLVNTIEWAGRGRIVDDRTLEDDGAGGVMLVQRVDFAHKASGKSSSSSRQFVRCDAPPPAALEPQHPATTAAGAGPAQAKARAAAAVAAIAAASEGNGAGGKSVVGRSGLVSKSARRVTGR